MIKLLKKICGIVGYKLVDKNLIKNDRIISKFSHHSIKNLLDKIFSQNLINTVVQIGANDGKRFDPLNEFLIKFSPKTILVEPIVENYNDLKLNYENMENILFENSAISVNNEINFLFKVDDQKLSLYDSHIRGITSFDKNHLLKHGVSNSHIKKEYVNSISFTDLTKKYSINNLDLLMIDVEGYDGDILIDFLLNSTLRPIIIFEYLHIKNDKFENLINQLISKNYVFFKIDENITCFPKENKKINSLI